jgi:hypothetical protein
LTPKTILLSITLREEYGISFFDSHHGATAFIADELFQKDDYIAFQKKVPYPAEKKKEIFKEKGYFICGIQTLC